MKINMFEGARRITKLIAVIWIVGWCIYLMCQHFSGQNIKQLFAVFHSPLGTNNYWLNEFVLGCKKPRCIQIYPVSLHPWFHNVDDGSVRSLRNERSFPKQVESTEGNLPLQLLTEPYVILSHHTALVIQPSNSKLSSEQTAQEIAYTTPLTID